VGNAYAIRRQTDGKAANIMPPAADRMGGRKRENFEEN